MSDDSNLRYLTYIAEAIALIEVRTRAGRTSFTEDVDIQDAVLWRLQTLALATGKLSKEVKDRHPEIRWRAVYGFRNIAAHGYLELCIDEVWEIIEVHLPVLKNAVASELGRLNTP